MREDLATCYAAQGVRFAFVGPLLDRPGASRAGGYKMNHEGDAAEGAATSTSASAAHSDAEIVERVRAARAVGRRVVLASMGTVVTGDHPSWGWNGRGGVSGKDDDG